MPKTEPSMDAWLAEAKSDPMAAQCGMFLTHNGVVRATPKAQVREGKDGLPSVSGVEFSYDPRKVEEAEQAALAMDGIFYVRTWLNEGLVETGGSLMYVLVGGDIRPHVVDALQFLVGKIKNEAVEEKEVYA